MKKTFGAVTIVQSPRPEISSDILHLLGAGYRVVEAGALDNLSSAEIAALLPQPGDEILVTRLLDGSTVEVAARHIAPLLQAQVNALFDKGLPLVALLCTGVFANIQAKGLLLRSQEILYQAAASLGSGLRLGVLCQSQEQIPQITRQWRDILGEAPFVLAATPYEGIKTIDLAAGELQAADVNLVVMDCIAYTRQMQLRLRDRTGVPVMLARGLVARMVKELLG